VKFLFLVVFIFSSFGIFAAPLEGGYVLAPRASASADERARAYSQIRRTVIEAAKKYEGVPYVYGGMTARGLDCSGFIGLSFRDALGVTIPRSASGMYSWAERIPYEKAQPGDFLFFRTGSTRSITHVALYLGNRNFIHSASAGSKTGVIYSSLNENYWSNAFAGAGRAFPETAGFTIDAPSVAGGNSGASNSGTSNSSASNSGGGGNLTTAENQINISEGAKISRGVGEGRLLLGAGIAPTWNGFIPGGNLVRGFSSQLLLGADTYSFGRRMMFGFELRPEYDGALGVFRLPITFSWGPNEQFRFFGGPVFSYGGASLTINDEQRNYSGGTTWLGAIGITAAPFTFKAAGGELSPYMEAAWQSYYRNSAGFNFSSDVSAALRFSTGLRWMTHVK